MEIATTGATELLTLSLKPHELDAHRAAIGVEVEAALNNGGYWREPSSELVKIKMLLKWMDALQNYTMQEIENAFAKHVLSKPKIKPNEGIIRDLIIKGRGRAAPAPRQTYEACKDPITPERHAALMAEYNSDGKVKVKSFEADRSHINPSARMTWEEK